MDGRSGHGWPGGRSVERGATWRVSPTWQGVASAGAGIWRRESRGSGSGYARILGMDAAVGDYFPPSIQ